MPAPLAAYPQDAKPAEGEVGEDDSVEPLYRRVGRNQREQNHARREEQGLRIGDGGMAGEMIRIPERDFAMAQSVGEEAEHRIEMIFGVPWNDRSADQPAGKRQTGESDERDRCQRA